MKIAQILLGSCLKNKWTFYNNDEGSRQVNWTQNEVSITMDKKTLTAQLPDKAFLNAIHALGTR